MSATSHAIGGCGIALAATMLIRVSAAQDDDSAVFSLHEKARIMSLSPRPAPPPDPTNRWFDDDAAAHLGRFLFFDTRLSGDNTMSCATCHEPSKWFTDGRPVAEGRGALPRHTLSVIDAAYQRWLFWDGRADSLWAQALEPIEHPRELAGSRLGVARLVHDDPSLHRAYERVFGSLPDMSDTQRFPPNGRAARPSSPDARHDARQAMSAQDRAAVDRVFANIGKAIAAYEHRLVSGESPFDRFVADLRSGRETHPSEFSTAARRGLKLFIGRAECMTCHFGPSLSDGEFHTVGVPPSADGQPDPGRFAGAQRVQRNPFNAAGPFSDSTNGRRAARVESLVHAPDAWGRFRTPSLRNVARTAPYMHQGQFDSLQEVARHYSTLENASLDAHHGAQVLRPLHLTEREMADLVAFLESLNGAPPPAALLTPPDSPLLEDH